MRIADRATVVEDDTNLKPSYDYVVVGGGTAGLTVAYRLTENPSGTFRPSLQRCMVIKTQ